MADFKVEPENVELKETKLNDNCHFKIECEEIHIKDVNENFEQESECKAEKNTSDDSEAADRLKCEDEEISEMFDGDKPQDIDGEKTDNLDNVSFKIECEEIHIKDDNKQNEQESDCTLEGNTRDDPEAAERIKSAEEISEMFKGDKQMVVLIKSEISKPTIGNQTENLRNLTFLEGKPENINGEKTTNLDNNFPFKIKCEEIHIKDDNDESEQALDSVLEGNTGDDSEAAGSPKFEEQEIDEMIDSKKKLVVLIVRDISKPTIANQTENLRNLKILEDSLEKIDEEKTTNLDNNFASKIECEEIHIKDDNDQSEQEIDSVLEGNTGDDSEAAESPKFEVQEIDEMIDGKKKLVVLIVRDNISKPTIANQTKNLRNLKILEDSLEKIDEEKTTNLDNNFASKIECEEIHIKDDNDQSEQESDSVLEGNTADDSEAAESSKFEEEQEIDEMIDSQKKLVVLIDRDNISNQTENLRNLKFLEDKPKDINGEKTANIDNNCFKIECEEIHIKDGNQQSEQESDLEENISDDSEAVNIENENSEISTCGKKLFVSIERYDISKHAGTSKNYLLTHTLAKNYKKTFSQSADHIEDDKDQSEQESDCALEENISDDSEAVDIKNSECIENEIIKISTCRKKLFVSIQRYDISKHREISKNHLLADIAEEKYKCNVCEKTFSQSGHLKRHLLIHTGEKNYKCENCEKTFSESGQLKAHLLIHTGEKKYECDICEKTFARKGNLKTHLLTHTGEKKFKCEICENTFSRSADLKRHLLIHTEEKKHKCAICKKTFLRRGGLKTHLLIHTGEKKYKCAICKIKFSRSGHLKSHLLIHSGQKKFKCAICGRTFSRRGHLKSHLLIHTGEKKYECAICQKLFLLRPTLKCHLLIHTGEKKYKCTNCKKTFSRFGHLKRHRLIHTKKKNTNVKFTKKSFLRSGDLKK